VGRTPNTKGIGLGQVGIELDEHGYIKINDRLETTLSNVWRWAIALAVRNFHTSRTVTSASYVTALNGGDRSTKHRIVPFCMFTDPELARVGRNETEATKSNIASRNCR
jgi:pyruvate/2-oxoglutarate dehydrogenase complex dihydrolipoamide dehydrogenase (E3) component